MSPVFLKVKINKHKWNASFVTNNVNIATAHLLN